MEYKNESIKLSINEEEELIARFLFSICIDYDIAIRIEQFIDLSNFKDDDDSEEESINYHNKIIPYSQAMNMFVEACSVNNSEIKFLYFYKIIEYFSPIVSNKKSYELLNQKLDALSISKRDHRYLDSIFNLTRKYDLSLRDKELAYTVIKECVDIIELFDYLPVSTKKYLYKTHYINNLTSLDAEKKDQIIKKISNILYATRNNFVHAKSNYHQTGDECESEDIDVLNIFMSKLCYCLIVWNSRQNEDYRT